MKKTLFIFLVVFFLGTSRFSLASLERESLRKWEKNEEKWKQNLLKGQLSINSPEHNYKESLKRLDETLNLDIFASNYKADAQQILADIIIHFELQFVIDLALIELMEEQFELSDCSKETGYKALLEEVKKESRRITFTPTITEPYLYIWQSLGNLLWKDFSKSQQTSLSKKSKKPLSWNMNQVASFKEDFWITMSGNKKRYEDLEKGLKESESYKNLKALLNEQSFLFMRRHKSHKKIFSFLLEYSHKALQLAKYELLFGQKLKFIRLQVSYFLKANLAFVKTDSILFDLKHLSYDKSSGDFHHKLTKFYLGKVKDPYVWGHKEYDLSGCCYGGLGAVFVPLKKDWINRYKLPYFENVVASFDEDQLIGVHKSLFLIKDKPKVGPKFKKEDLIKSK